MAIRRPLNAICGRCKQRWERHTGDDCQDGVPGIWDDGLIESDVSGHSKKLDWDPKKRTPFDPFADWKGKTWGADRSWSRRDIDNHAANQNGAVHNLQKG